MTYRPKSCIIQIHGITTPHLIRSTTFVFENLSVEILILRVFVAQMATHVVCPENHNFPNMLCRLSRDLGYPQCPEYVFKDIIENRMFLGRNDSKATIPFGSLF